MIRKLPPVVVVAALALTPSAEAAVKKPVKRAKIAPRKMPPPVMLPPPVPYPPAPPTMPLAPPPPAPPLVNPPGVAAKPVGSPGQWVTPDDYPADSRRAGETGRVIIRLALDRLGRPYRCWVVQSSGSDRLDATTCYLMQSRARFTPAMGLDGKSIEWTYQLSMRWTIEEEVDVPPVAAPPSPPAPPKRAVKKKVVRKGTRR